LPSGLRPSSGGAQAFGQATLDDVVTELQQNAVLLEAIELQVENQGELLRAAQAEQGQQIYNGGFYIMASAMFFVLMFFALGKTK